MAVLTVLTVLAAAVLAACSGTGAPREPTPHEATPDGTGTADVPSPDTPPPAPRTPPGPRPSALPDWMAPPGPVPACPDATVRVRTADELQDALDEAGPGTVVALADGVHEGRFTITTSGTRADPARLCGSPAAVLDGGSTREGYVLHLDGADHWVVQGVTVRQGQKGVMVDASDGVVLRGLTVHTIGDEAIHLRRGTTDAVVEHNVVSDTGLREPRFGEGVYVGSAHSNWCDLTGCEPDRSDRNVVRGNVVHGTTAEAVDVKEGTSGGAVVGNQVDGSAITAADSWIAVKGNAWRIADNTGRHSPRDGIQVHVVQDGWGEGNHVTGNTGVLDVERGRLVRDDAPGTRADCTNRLEGGPGRDGLGC